MSMDSDSEQMVLDSVDNFLETDVRPVAHKLEAADEYPTQIVEKMKELGLFGCTIPEEYGGVALLTLSYPEKI